MILKRLNGKRRSGKIQIEIKRLKGRLGCPTALKNVSRVLVENHMVFVPGIDKKVKEFMVSLGYREQETIDYPMLQGSFSFYVPI